MPAGNRTVDLLVGAFDLNQRRKFELKNADGKKIVDLYFKPITRADRKKAAALAGSEEALDISTQMLCQMAELEELPESVLNDIELFLFGIADETVEIDDAKND
jgi:hypothetical protein